jgi:hypothetical protein
MPQHELREMLSRLLPYVKGQKQATALFTVVLLVLLGTQAEYPGMRNVVSPELAAGALEFDAPHLHVEFASIQPTFDTMGGYNGS